MPGETLQPHQDPVAQGPRRPLQIEKIQNLEKGRPARPQPRVPRHRRLHLHRGQLEREPRAQGPDGARQVPHLRGGPEAHLQEREERLPGGVVVIDEQGRPESDIQQRRPLARAEARPSQEEDPEGGGRVRRDDAGDVQVRDQVRGEGQRGAEVLAGARRGGEGLCE